MAKEHHYEIVDTLSNKVSGELWWDGKNVQADDPEFLDYVAQNFAPSTGLSPSDGVNFLKKLPSMFRNGYMFARKKKD